MKRILLLALLLLMIFPWQTAATDLTPEQERINGIQNAMNATVKISAALGNTGSGFFIGEYMILTNSHVAIVPGMTGTIMVTKADKTTCTGKLSYHEEAMDLALIQVNCAGDPLDLASYVSIGQDVFITGNPSSQDFMATSGIVSKIFDQAAFRYVVADIPAERGSSGSPMIDSKGNVVGVVKGIQKNANFLVYAIPQSEVRSFLKRAG